MTHEELMLTPEYWTTRIQLELFNKVECYLKENKLTRSDFAKKIGVSKGYVTQILNGDFDHRLSKLVEISIAIGYFPDMSFKKRQEVLSDKSVMLNNVFKQLGSINQEGFIQQKSDFNNSKIYILQTPSKGKKTQLVG